MNIVLLFFILSIINVISATVKSIITIKGNAVIAGLVSGAYFAFYNIMLIYTVAEFDLWQKCAITFVCNVFGVWVVKFIEKKMEKTKMWKIEATIPTENKEEVDKKLRCVPHSCIEISPKHTLFNFYCSTKEESKKVKNLCSNYNAKFFAAENKFF